VGCCFLSSVFGLPTQRRLAAHEWQRFDIAEIDAPQSAHVPFARLAYFSCWRQSRLHAVAILPEDLKILSGVPHWQTGVYCDAAISKPPVSLWSEARQRLGAVRASLIS